jgi:hypothetical protein
VWKQEPLCRELDPWVQLLLVQQAPLLLVQQAPLLLVQVQLQVQQAAQ